RGRMLAEVPGPGAGRTSAEPGLAGALRMGAPASARRRTRGVSRAGAGERRRSQGSQGRSGWARRRVHVGGLAGRRGLARAKVGGLAGASRIDASLARLSPRGEAGAGERTSSDGAQAGEVEAVGAVRFGGPALLVLEVPGAGLTAGADQTRALLGLEAADGVDQPAARAHAGAAAVEQA